MRTLLRIAVAAVLAISVCPLAGAEAGWIEDGTPVHTAQWDQYYIQTVPDGEGGAVIVWASQLNEGGYLKADIYAQRLDRRGNPLWSAPGVGVCVYSDDQNMPRIVPDGEGGYIIAWYDQRSGYGDIYAQRLDAAGVPQWTANGIPVCAAASNQGYVEMTTVQGGGAIIAWQDDRNATGWDIYAQRLANDGSAVWTVDGVMVCDDTSFQEDIAITTNGAKGALIVWEDKRNVSTDIYAEEIDSTGAIDWAGAGNPLCTDTANQLDPVIVYSGEPHNGIVAWTDQRATGSDIYGTRLQNSWPAWAADGIPLASAADYQSYPALVARGGYEVYLCWRDSRDGNADIYAQRLNLLGDLYWGSGGLPVCTYMRDQYLSDIDVDGAGNLIVAWSDTRYIYNDIYAQKLDPAGDPLWRTGGIVVSDEYYVQGGPSIASSGEGAFILAWEDQRDYSNQGRDLYAMRVDGSGIWGYPAPAITSIDDVPHDQGGSVTVAWAASQVDAYPYELATHYSVWRSLSGPEAAALLASGEKSVEMPSLTADFEGTAYRLEMLGAAAYGWEWLGNAEAHRLEAYTFTAPTLYDSTSAGGGWQHFFVATHTEDPYVYWDSEPDSGYSVDNLAPCEPLSLAGAQEYSPAGLRLTWDPNSELDLSHYNVYRGADSGFIPGAGSLLSCTADTTLFDSGWGWESEYWYKVAAVDIHGNESSFAVLGPGGVTGDDTPEAPLAAYLSQNAPNPFNPVTGIRFGLKAPGHVSLRIYDTTGRLVRVLADGRRPAGHFTETWDGLSDRGAAVASGVYFCRMRTAGYGRTIKMIMLR